MKHVTVVQLATISKDLVWTYCTLRMNRETPAWKAMVYYFESAYCEKKFRGHRRTTLVTALNENITVTKNSVNLPILESLRSLEDMRVLRKIGNHGETLLTECVVLCKLKRTFYISTTKTPSSIVLKRTLQ